MIRVLFICHGNICRSTLSESVFTYKVKELGLSDRFVIDSAATSTEEIGNPPHRGTVNKLRDIADPWYTGDFDATYNDVIEGCEGFLEYLKQENKI